MRNILPGLFKDLQLLPPKPQSFSTASGLKNSRQVAHFVINLASCGGEGPGLAAKPTLVHILPLTCISCTNLGRHLSHHASVSLSVNLGYHLCRVFMKINETVFVKRPPAPTLITKTHEFLVVDILIVQALLILWKLHYSLKKVKMGLSNTDV